MFRKRNVGGILYAVVFGESALNDAVGVVLSSEVCLSLGLWGFGSGDFGVWAPKVGVCGEIELLGLGFGGILGVRLVCS